MKRKPKTETRPVICPACCERPAECGECKGEGAITATRWMKIEMAKKKGETK